MNKPVKPNAYAALSAGFSSFDCVERGAKEHALQSVLAALRTDSPEAVEAAAVELDARHEQVEALEGCLDLAAGQLFDEVCEGRQKANRRPSIAKANLLVMALSDLCVEAAGKLRAARRLASLKNGGRYGA